MAQGKGRKLVKLLHNGSYPSLEQDVGKDLEEEPSSSEPGRARRLLSDPKPQTSRRKLLSSPRPSTANTRKLIPNPRPPETDTRKVYLNPRPPTTTTPNLLSNPRPMNNEEISQGFYSSSFLGWATSTLPRDLHARHLLQEALIPSPLVDDDWDNLKPEPKAAWLDILSHTSSETRALYNYIRENLPDIDEFIFGGEKEFPSKCKSGLLCNLVKDDNSADNYLYIDSDDEDIVPITMFRKRWITGDFVIPLDPQAGSGQLHTAAAGRALSSASSSLELRRLSLDNNDRYGYFITNGSLAPLFVNGISIGMNMVAGPLPDFAVIDAEGVVFFWWCTLHGVTYIPKDLPTVQWSHVSGYGRSKRTIGAVEEYENLNDEAPIVKRPKLDESLVDHAGTPRLTDRSTRGSGDRINGKQATKEKGKRNRTAAVGGQTTPQPAKHPPIEGTENSLYSPSSWNNEYRRRMTTCDAKANGKDGPQRTAHHIISTKESNSLSASGKRGLRYPSVGNLLVPGRDSTTPGKHPPAPPQDPPAQGPPALGGEPSAPEEDPPAPGEGPSGPGVHSPGSGGDPSAPGGDSSPWPASWEAILDAGIERHTEHFEQQSAEFQSNCTHIKSPINMMDESVVLAIASLWDGLRRAGTIFGFGTADTFRCNRSQDTVVQGLTAVSGPHPLIIPLLMNDADIHTPPPPKSAKGGTRSKKTTVSKRKGKETDKTSLHHGSIGHFVLTIAERRSDDIVEITIKDSRPGYIRVGDLFTAARGFITHSGWMGIDPQGNPMPANPIFTSENYPVVPIQRHGNTCGLYAILNAWAYMLKIPIREARVYDAVHNHHRFHATALMLINLALAGCMDSSTIQAFFNVWKYAVQQDVNNLTVHVVRAEAQRMDPRILQDRIMEQRDLDQALALEPPPTEAQITQVTDLGTSREMAIQQLKLATDDAQTVAANLMAARSSPGAAGLSKPPEEDVAFVVEVTGFPPESVSAELTRARGDRNKAINNILDQYKTGNSPTGSRSASTPHKAGNLTAPPDTGLEHSYDEVDIGRLMSYRDISLNTVLRQLDRAGGDVGKAEERIRHLSNALSSNSGSSESHHSAANNYGPFDPKSERPYTDADVVEIMAIKHQVQEQVSEERKNSAGNVDRSRKDMIKGLTRGEQSSSINNQEDDPELHPYAQHMTSERSPPHAETLTSPIRTPVTTDQVNPLGVDLPDSSTPHKNIAPSGNIEQPQAMATQAPQLRREVVFPEEDVNTLTSIGYSRAEAIFALEMGEGDLARAVDYLYAQFQEE